MEVVDKIKDLPTGSKAGFQDVPTSAIVINKATLEK